MGRFWYNDPINFLEIATRFVRGREEAHLEGLAQDTLSAHHRAEHCGCLQCKKSYVGAADRFTFEDNRLNMKTPDQEEKFVMDWTINNRLLGGPKE